MKSLIAIAGLIALSACSPLSDFSPGSAGNPDAQPYAGAPGSVYDQAANPPSFLGMVSYNPEAPLPPADMTRAPNGQPR